MAILDEAQLQVLEELGAPNFVSKLTYKDFNTLREWVTELIHDNQGLAEDEIDALLYTDNECRA